KRPTRAPGVLKQRYGEEEGAPRVQAEPVHVVRPVTHQRVVPQQRALGESGRARGELDLRKVVRENGRQSAASVAVEQGRMVGQIDDVADLRQLRRNLVGD